MASAKGAKRKKIDIVEENEKDFSTSDEHFVETLQTVLGRYYYRSTERLQMKVKPPCYSNLEKCSRNHWKSHDINIAAHDVQLDCRIQRQNKKFTSFFSSINNLCLHGRFPGPEILNIVLQIILDVPEDYRDHEEEPPSFILNTCIQTFEMVLMHFPPCILQLEPSYSAFLIQRCDLDGLVEFGKDGIIPCLVDFLEKLLDSDGPGGLVADMGSADTEEELKLINDELKETAFGYFQQKTKQERVFVIMHLTVKLMEYDLAMWMLRHPKKASESMLKTQKQPLIAKILWPRGEFAVTPFMKKCFTVFVSSIYQELPGDQMEIFGRLIGLIANAVNLCEMQTTSEVQYPCIRQKSTNLAEIFMEIITENKANTPSVTVKVIRNIPSPITKMLMIDLFFSSSINPEPGSMCITKILKIFKNRQWVVQNKISQTEFVNLFMDATKCWIEVYRLHEVFETFSHGDPHNGPPETKKAKPPIKERVADIEKKTGKKIHVDYTALNRDLGKILKKYKLDGPIKYNELNLDYNVIGIADIYQIYLDEMKSVLKLHALLANRHKKYPSLFEPWMALIEKYFGFALIK